MRKKEDLCASRSRMQDAGVRKCKHKSLCKGNAMNAMQVTQCNAMHQSKKNKESISIPRSICSGVTVQCEVGRDRQVCRHRNIAGRSRGECRIEDKTRRLDNKHLLHILACVALSHAVPRRVCERAAENPGNGDSGLGSIGSLGLGSHLDDARSAARGAGRVKADGGARAGDGGYGDTGCEAGEHGVDLVVECVAWCGVV